MLACLHTAMIETLSVSTQYSEQIENLVSRDFVDLKK